MSREVWIIVTMVMIMAVVLIVSFLINQSSQNLLDFFQGTELVIF